MEPQTHQTSLHVAASVGNADLAEFIINRLKQMEHRKSKHLSTVVLESKHAVVKSAKDLIRMRDDKGNLAVNV